jgi:trk system potassium uptake protein TrkH
MLCAIVWIARRGSRTRRPARSQLLVLPGVFAALPLMLAVPYAEATGLPLLTSYAEMVSSLTTTGLTYTDPALVVAPGHLWRAILGWLGGLFVWTAAAAILAPMNLGGFEVGAPGEAGRGAASLDRSGTTGDPVIRMARVASDLVPIYAGLTLGLWILLVAAGQGAFAALCHAMATLSTSGISPVGGLAEGGGGVGAEMAVALFLVLALSRPTFLPGGSPGMREAARSAELRLAAWLVAAVAATLFLRHWLAAADRGDPADLGAAGAALWGALFTALGFLSTAGFESVHWEASRNWSGLEAAGPILLLLALTGGGVATTAGGIKLFRVHALMKHGQRELERLVHPSSIGGAGRRARRIRKQGARVAFVFFMLFVLALAATTLALAATGIDFENAMALAAAALSNTGPLAQAAPVAPIAPSDLDAAARIVLSAAMVLGRLEMLAVVALLNPNVWRT